MGKRTRLLLNPLLGLMAHQLAVVVSRTPRLNSTILDGKRYEYAGVNLGFTIQAGQTLYLAVVPDAGRKDRLTFVQALTDLQRRAMAHRLMPADLKGATIGFTSMERWRVSRHVPILPPYVSLMVAHTIDRDERGVLGVTYDHRVLSGADAVLVLRQLTAPLPDEDMEASRSQG
jgi:pyruvate/2-oxoglutarate dehydrogenase complex dihydrolipoamide acyltransferase (E2) component